MTLSSGDLFSVTSILYPCPVDRDDVAPLTYVNKTVLLAGHEMYSDVIGWEFLKMSLINLEFAECGMIQ